MDTLFRVVPLAQWQEARARGYVLRCGADERHDRIHLNRLQDVERAADLWFSPGEQPVALEIDVSTMDAALRWELRSEPPLEVWPNLYLPNLPVGSVIAVRRLTHHPGRGFELGASVAG